MKLIIEITTKDEVINKYECVDFPSYGNEFITLYLPNFVRSMIRLETISYIKQYFNK